jgi:t-SNARE complex subunit (syntaxin)
MESIEKTIVDLGKIFQQLGSMIKEQDELITR